MLGASEIAEDARKIEAMGRSGRIAEANKILAPFEGKLSGFQRLIAEIAAGPDKAKKRGRKTGPATSAKEKMMKKILVADDDRATRHMLKTVLGEAGFEVSVAVDGNAALKKVRDGGFDLLLTDVWMPGMNGLELLARLREEPNDPRTIVMTSDDTSEVMLRAIREQAYHYFQQASRSHRGCGAREGRAFREAYLLADRSRSPPCHIGLNCSFRASSKPSPASSASCLKSNPNCPKKTASTSDSHSGSCLPTQSNGEESSIRMRKCASPT